MKLEKSLDEVLISSFTCIPIITFLIGTLSKFDSFDLNWSESESWSVYPNTWNCLFWLQIAIFCLKYISSPLSPESLNLFFPVTVIACLLLLFCLFSGLMVLLAPFRINYFKVMIWKFTTKFSTLLSVHAYLAWLVSIYILQLSITSN